MNTTSSEQPTPRPFDDEPSLEGLRVLIVDDEPEMREFVCSVLSRRGAEVCVARTAREALAFAESWRPDILVSDLEMPDDNGFTLIEWVRSLGSGRGGDVPAVALSGHVGIEDCERAFAAGFQAHVAKPLEPGDLVWAVANAASP